MEPLTGSLKKDIAQRLIAAPHAFIFLDYDGTITPIVAKPEFAVLSQSTRGILEKLAERPNFSVGIITGRQIDDVRAMVGSQKLIYAANHGLELQGKDFNYTHAKAKQYKRIIREVLQALQPLPNSFSQTFVEDKGVTGTYHFRLLDEASVQPMKAEFLNRISPWLQANKIRVTEAKKALEIRPNFSWTKGSAVRWILLHEDPESVPIFFGDDQTDESAFKALNDRGITVKVGQDRKTHAQYFVKDVEEVVDFLSSMTQRRGESGFQAAAV